MSHSRQFPNFLAMSNADFLEWPSLGNNALDEEAFAKWSEEDARREAAQRQQARANQMSAADAELQRALATSEAAERTRQSLLQKMFDADTEYAQKLSKQNAEEACQELFQTGSRLIDELDALEKIPKGQNNPNRQLRFDRLANFILNQSYDKFSMYAYVQELQALKMPLENAEKAEKAEKANQQKALEREAREAEHARIEKAAAEANRIAIEKATKAAQEQVRLMLQMQAENLRNLEEQDRAYKAKAQAEQFSKARNGLFTEGVKLLQELAQYEKPADALKRYDAFGALYADKSSDPATINEQLRQLVKQVFPQLIEDSIVAAQAKQKAASEKAALIKQEETSRLLAIQQQQERIAAEKAKAEAERLQAEKIAKLKAAEKVAAEKVISEKSDTLFNEIVKLLDKLQASGDLKYRSEKSTSAYQDSSKLHSVKDLAGMTRMLSTLTLAVNVAEMRKQSEEAEKLEQAKAAKLAQAKVDAEKAAQLKAEKAATAKIEAEKAAQLKAEKAATAKIEAAKAAAEKIAAERAARYPSYSKLTVKRTFGNYSIFSSISLDTPRSISSIATTSNESSPSDLNSSPRSPLSNRK